MQNMPTFIVENDSGTIDLSNMKDNFIRMLAPIPLPIDAKEELAWTPANARGGGIHGQVLGF